MSASVPCLRVPRDGVPHSATRPERSLARGCETHRDSQGFRGVEDGLLPVRVLPGSALDSTVLLRATYLGVGAGGEVDGFVATRKGNVEPAKEGVNVYMDGSAMTLVSL